MAGMAIRTFLLEQYAESRILTMIGVLRWLVLPIPRLRRSRLQPALAWSIVATIAGLIVHGLFWGQSAAALRDASRTRPALSECAYGPPFSTASR